MRQCLIGFLGFAEEQRWKDEINGCLQAMNFWIELRGNFRSASSAAGASIECFENTGLGFDVLLQ